ncbi:hypothetical protein J1N35_009721, partial [Gossypium stocksii]
MNVNIWNDAWVPGAGNGRIQCQQIDIRYSKVSDLINHDDVTWKHGDIRALFGEEQMEKIISIPLTNRESPDILVWRGDKIGVYTAKSGYFQKIATEGNVLHHTTMSKFYKQIWGLKVPSRIRIHLWTCIS